MTSSRKPAQREPSTPGSAAEGLSDAAVIEDARPGALAQRKLQAGAADSPQARRIAQLRSMVEGSPAQLRQGGVVQRLEEGEARKRLGALEGGQDSTVAVLIDIHAVRDAIPRLETALGQFPEFLAQYPVQVQGFKSGVQPTQKVIRDLFQKHVNDLLEKLTTFVDVLDEVEDWYMDAEPKERELTAEQYRAQWRKARDIFEPADGDIGALFASYLETVPEIENTTGYKVLWKLREYIASWFKTSGGFSAVGRAHDIPTAIVDADPLVDKGFPEDENFVSGYYQGGEDATSVSEKINVSKTPTGPVVNTGPTLVQGVKYTVPPTALGTNLPKLQESTEQGITALSAASWKADLKGPPAPRDRGDGQYANMNRTNARGYAWLNNIGGWDSHGWEWLHVRAASLGGATDGSNLVLGTADANTLMIPFESNIRLLAGLVKNYSTTLDKLSVQWNVGGGDGHARDTIHVTWKLVPKENAPKAVETVADEASGELVVANLYTRANLAKDEVRWIEGQLANFREVLKSKQDEV